MHLASNRYTFPLITFRTRISDLLATVIGSALFTLVFDPVVTLTTIYNVCLDRMKIRNNRFQMRPGRFAKHGNSNMTIGS